MKQFMYGVVVASLVMVTGQAISQHDGFATGKFSADAQYLRQEIVDLGEILEVVHLEHRNMKEAILAGGERDDRQQDQINALADKLDDDDVLLMDTDYRATIEAL